MSSLLTTGLPPAVLQPLFRQLKDQSVNAALGYWAVRISERGRVSEGDCAPFLEYCESVRMMRMFVLCGTVSKTRAIACNMFADT